VFAKKDGLLIPNYEISKRFKKIALAAGLRSDAHFHETRHTLATELIEMGVNQFKVQALLGHATLDMTKRYTHLNVDSQDEIINKLNKKRSRSKKS
jgi:site-specific recombinase XerD